MSYQWKWEVFLTPAAGNQTYLDWLVSGFLFTVSLGLAAWLLALASGAVLGVARTLPNKAVAPAAVAPVVKNGF